MTVPRLVGDHYAIYRIEEDDGGEIEGRSTTTWGAFDLLSAAVRRRPEASFAIRLIRTNHNEPDEVIAIFDPEGIKHVGEW